jgi:hypothetical protein
MMIAIQEDEWAVFHDLSPMALGEVLRELAGNVRLSEYRKQPRGPKKPQPKRRIGWCLALTCSSCYSIHGGNTRLKS